MSFVMSQVRYVDDAGLPTGEQAPLILPESAFLRRKAEEIAERHPGVQSTEYRNDQAAPPAAGTTFVWPDHERNQREERPLIVYDWRSGRQPLAVICGGVYRWQEVLDQVAEYRHYEEPDPFADWDRVAGPDQVSRDGNAWVEQILSRARGRSVFAFGKRGGLKDEWI